MNFQIVKLAFEQTYKRILPKTRPKCLKRKWASGSLPKMFRRLSQSSSCRQGCRATFYNWFCVDLDAINILQATPQHCGVFIEYAPSKVLRVRRCKRVVDVGQREVVHEFAFMHPLTSVPSVVAFYLQIEGRLQIYRNVDR